MKYVIGQFFNAIFYLIAFVLIFSLHILSSPFIIAAAYPRYFIIGVFVALGISLASLLKKRTSMSAIVFFFFLWSLTLTLIIAGSFAAGIFTSQLSIKEISLQINRGLHEI
jgi:hypothetical protein